MTGTATGAGLLGLHSEGRRPRVPHVETVRIFGASEGVVRAYLQAVQGARAGTRRVAWRLLSRVNRAFSSVYLA